VADHGWLTARPIAHRGLHDLSRGVLENTLPAVAAAAEAGYAIEIDLQPSGDGEAMVFHDPTLDRLMSAQGRIVDRSAAELATLGFKADPGLRIPRLAEVLDVVAGRVPLIIEIKSDLDREGVLERRLLTLLGRYTGPVGVMSFNPRSLTLLRDLDPDIPRGILSMAYTDERSRAKLSRSRRFMLRHLLHAGHTRPDFVAYDVRALPAPAPLALKRLFGLPLLTWTVRDEGERQRAARWADQIIFEGFRA